MAYQTGNYTGSDDILNIIRAFVVTNGWTQLQYEAVGTGYRLHIQKGSVFVNLRSCTDDTGAWDGYNSECTGLAERPSTGHSSSSEWWDQPGAPDSDGGPYVGFMSSSEQRPYHIFELPDCICVFISTQYGWQQLLFGMTTKEAHIHSASMSSDKPTYNTRVDNFLKAYSAERNTNIWANDEWCFYYRSGYSGILSPRDSWVEDLLSRSGTQFRGNYFLGTTHFGVGIDQEYDPTDNPVMYVGHVEGLKLVNMNGLSNETVVSYAGDEYVIVNISTGNDYGVAARK